MELGTISFKLVGINPIITDNPTQLKTELKGPKLLHTDKNTPGWIEAEGRTYRLDDNTLGFVSKGVIKCLMNGCQGLKIGRFSAKTMVQGCLISKADLIGFTNGTGKGITDFELQPLLRKNKKGNMVLGHYPLIRDWNMNCEFMFYENVDVTVIEEALDIAGVRFGLGLDRPGLGHGGRYGMFNIEDIKHEK